VAADDVVHPRRRGAANVLIAKEGKLMSRAILAAALCLSFVPALHAQELNKVTVTQVLSTMVTSSGQPIVLPKDAQLNVAIFDIPPGATLPVHKHPFPRYAYVLAGTLKVTNQDAGRADTFKKGDFIVEAVDQWHLGTAVGDEPVKLLVIDMVEKGQNNTIIKK
jgi:quercetin dioxygenase-like cupin family protein